jgi:hypothetical protein
MNLNARLSMLLENWPAMSAMKVEQRLTTVCDHTGQRWISTVEPVDDFTRCPNCATASAPNRPRLCDACGWNGDWIQPANGS